jgi:arsenate reductase
MTQAQEAVLYGIANCDTVKRSRAWLSDHAVPHRFHDYKKLGVPSDALSAWMAELGWERLLNRQGTTWRKLGEEEKSVVVDAPSAMKLMLAQSSVIRRPVVQWPSGDLTVGFDAEVFARLASA